MISQRRRHLQGEGSNLSFKFSPKLYEKNIKIGRGAHVTTPPNRQWFISLFVVVKALREILLNQDLWGHCSGKVWHNFAKNCIKMKKIRMTKGAHP